MKEHMKKDMKKDMKKGKKEEKKGHMASMEGRVGKSVKKSPMGDCR